MNKKFHYGWLVVIACMFLNAIGTGIFSSIFGLFFPSIVEKYGFSQASVAGIISVAIVGGLFATGVFSKLYKKHSIRHLVLIFGVLNGLSYMLMSQASSLGMMYLVGALIGIFGMGATALSAPMLITRWFKDRRATAMGIAVAGSGLGPAIMSPIITKVLSNNGPEAGFLVLGGMVLFSMITSFLLIRNNPEDIGMTPYETVKGNEAVKNTGEPLKHYTVKEAFKSKMFGSFVLFIIVMCTVVQGVLIQIPSYLNSTGISMEKVGTIIAAYAFTASFGKIIIGFVFDRLGVFKGNFLFFSLIIAALIALIMTEHMSQAAYVYVVCAGIGLGITPVAVPLLVSQLFGTKHYSGLYPVFMITMSFGAIVGGILAGVLIDSLGYSSFLYFSVGGAVLAFVLVQITLMIASKVNPAGRVAVEEA